MTLKDLLGQVVQSLEINRDDINAADPSHPDHGDQMLSRFQQALAVAPSDPNADLGAAMQQISGVISGTGTGFTSKAYSEAFNEGAQMFQGRQNQFSLNDLGPIIGMIAGGFQKNDTRGMGAAGPMAALGPLLGILTGQGGGGMLGNLGNVANIIGMLTGRQAGIGGLLGSLLGGGQQQQQGGLAGLGGLLGGLLGGQQQQQQQGGLGGMLGGLLGGGQQQQQQNNMQQGGMNDILGQLMGALNHGSQMTNANGGRDAGAASTSAVLKGLLGAFANQMR